MSEYRSPSQHSAHWMTSLQASSFKFFPPFCPDPVTSAGHTVDVVSFRNPHINSGKSQLTRIFVGCVGSALPILLPLPCSSRFRDYLNTRILSDSPSFRGALSTAGSYAAPPRREFLFSTLVFPPYPTRSSWLSSAHSPALGLFVTAERHLNSLLVHSGRLMLEDLPNERFRREKTALLLCIPLHQLLLDWPPLTASNPLPLPKALLVWHRVTPAIRSLKSDLCSLAQPVRVVSRAVSRAAQHASRQLFHLLFHSEYPQGAESKHTVSKSHTSSVKDWLMVVTKGRQAQ